MYCNEYLFVPVNFSWKGCQYKETKFLCEAVWEWYGYRAAFVWYKHTIGQSTVRVLKTYKVQLNIHNWLHCIIMVNNNHKIIIFLTDGIIYVPTIRYKVMPLVDNIGYMPLVHVMIALDDKNLQRLFRGANCSNYHRARIQVKFPKSIGIQWYDMLLLNQSCIVVPEW